MEHTATPTEPSSGLSSAERVDYLVYAGFVIAFSIYILRRLLWLKANYPGYSSFAFDCVAIVFAAVLLCALVHPRAQSLSTARRAVLAGGSLGVIFFVSTLGFALVDPTNVEWLMRGDWATNFVGWHLYRNAPWGWPPGAYDAYVYPVGTAIIFSDSVPLVAMPLKLISGWLPARFQYFGFCLLLSCILQGTFGALLIRCFTPRLAMQALGAGILLLAPVLIYRIGHISLTMHWMLLAAFWLYFRPAVEPTRNLYAWVVLSAISALIQPYLNVMILAIAFAYYWRAGVAQPTLRRRAAVMHMCVVVAASVASWWLCGLLIMRPGTGGVNLGIYNANLLTWLDSQSISRWIPALPHARPGQYEGTGYLGLGVFLLVGLAIPLRLFRREPKFSPWVLWPLILLTVGFTLYAFSIRWTLGSIVLFDLKPPSLQLLGTFRSCGRFIWPSVYLITMWAIVVVAQRSGRLASLLLAGAFFIELLDISPLHLQDAQMRVGKYDRPMQPILHAPFWVDATARMRHITLVPSPYCGEEAAPYFPFSLLAGDRGLTINTGYVARFDEQRAVKNCDDLNRQLESGSRDADTLYIVHPNLLEHFQTSSSVVLDCRLVEGYHACRVAVPRENAR